MNEILEMNIGLLLGLINEKNNQYDIASRESKNNKDKEEVVNGTVAMLKAWG